MSLPSSVTSEILLFDRKSAVSEVRLPSTATSVIELPSILRTVTLTACSSPVRTEMLLLNRLRVPTSFAISSCVIVAPDDLPVAASSAVRRLLSGIATAVAGKAASCVVAVFDGELSPTTLVARIWKWYLVPFVKFGTVCATVLEALPEMAVHVLDARAVVLVAWRTE